MFKLEKIVENIGGSIQFIENTLASFNSITSRVIAFDLDESEIKWEDENKSGICYTYKNEIFTPNMTFYNIKGEVLFENPTEVNLNFGIKGGDISFWVNSIDWRKKMAEYYLFNLNTKQFIRKNILLPDGGIKLIHQDLLAMTKEGRIFVYNYETEQILWERDFSEEFAHEDFLRKNKWHKGSVGKVYLYKEDKIIVTVSGSNSFCFDINTGNEIWQIGYSGWYIFQNNIAFVYAGKSLAKIDLDAGKILSNNGSYYPLPDLPPVIHKKHGEITIWASGTIMLYHEEYLWYLVNSNGFYFLVKINPDTFAYENIQEIKNTADIDFMQFYKDKLYLRDLKSNLYVYEKE